MKKIVILMICNGLVFAGGMAYNQVTDFREKKSNSKEKALYINECGSCHMPYQPQFLPKKSWIKMMKNLDNHFKTDATVEPEDYKNLKDFLLKNASDSKESKRVGKYYRKIANSIPKHKTLLRISNAPYFQKEHREFPKKYITQKEVKSIANCIACHKDAEKGTYQERSIFIPNYGRWDD
ncbi:cytochrome C [Sulfurimonas sediminis]|uniref:Cytochrome C n=1 Tax=Sulfurimonas sediminis TaxID=2590020 RepID=A0A7M1B5M0_9BACT|nr:diheme cytochrome c [Sulfurimonas sediminis]QOP43992.1 cytochrome C [Sulfurimonas sediminis]